MWKPFEKTLLHDVSRKPAAMITAGERAEAEDDAEDGHRERRGDDQVLALEALHERHRQRRAERVAEEDHGREAEASRRCRSPSRRARAAPACRSRSSRPSAGTGRCRASPSAGGTAARKISRDRARPSPGRPRPARARAARSTPSSRLGGVLDPARRAVGLVVAAADLVPARRLGQVAPHRAHDHGAERADDEQPAPAVDQQVLARDELRADERRQRHAEEPERVGARPCSGRGPGGGSSSLR